MIGIRADLTEQDLPEVYYSIQDYSSSNARWCPGCGDHAILTAVQKLCREKQLPPEKTVFVSGIGCSSRFPHYMKTYGFHGLHGRAFPVAEGVKFRRPDLDVFVVTGDGDCCSIGAGHWVHAVRYNMYMVALLFDNEIYGLTKKQTSPTSPKGTFSNTHPKGSVLPPLNPIQSTLGFANVSFVAQTADWHPAHLYATIKKAHEHPGFSFVRILQRCPVWMNHGFSQAVAKDNSVTLLDHANGIELDPQVRKSFKQVIQHDPSDILKAREYAELEDSLPLGLFYQNTEAERYDEYGAHNLHMPVKERLSELNGLLDRYAI
ncbi:MAG: 2-oxoglutarate oxidoreductase [Flavobacteriales bacterium]|nr:2-oxoglutarate oxidoreductase [Flavobacteriales bacterium]